MHSSTVPPNRHLAKQRKRKKHHKSFLQQKSKLEGIQEKDPDSVSRKFSEKDFPMQDMEERGDTPLSDSHDGSNSVFVARPSEMNDSPSSSREKSSIASVTVGETAFNEQSKTPSIVVSHHAEDAKPEFDRSSSTSSGFTGSEKSEKDLDRQLSDLLK